METRLKNYLRYLASFFLSCVLYFVPCTLLLAHPVLAAETNFAITQEVIYQIRDDGGTTVTQNLALTNLTSESFPQEYLLKIGKLKIFNLHASDRLGPLQINSNVTADGNEVHLKFNDQVLGLGKILRLTLTYETSEIAQKQGRLWEIIIPPPPKLPGLTNFVVRLIVPASFGQKVFSKPEPRTSDLFWDGNDLKSTPVNVIYSPDSDNIYQVLDFNLKYQLYNSRLYPVASEIALPPDTEHQKIFLYQLTPKPANVRLDEDGNWLAEYPLGPAEKLDVLATGSAAIFLQPKSAASADERFDNYLKAEKYWPSTDSQIQKIAKNLPTPEAIYNYILTTLDYQPGSANTNRPGGRGVLLSPTKAGPQEFSDLFITLARSNNLPSREIDGYLAGRNHGRHLWPEYFDPDAKQWVMVDPALSKITSGFDFFKIFDLNHLTVFIKGTNKTPILANDSKVKPAAKNLDFRIIPKTLASANVPKEITAGFSASGQLFIENPGPTFFPNEILSLKANNLDLQNPILLTGGLPPFGHRELAIKTLPTPWNSQFNDIITLKFGYNKQSYPVKVTPLYKNGYLVLFGGLIILGIISIITQIARSLPLQKPDRRDHLRRQG